jgi:dTDP-4-amino-4,6-dideoxygalactose transaminase
VISLAQHVHPDQEWIRAAHDALDAWLATAASAPTSSVLGSGAIAAAEAAFSAMHNARPALLLPAGTYALRVGLQVLEVRRGDEVICGAVDWTAGLAAIRSLGARPVPVPVDPATLTLDPAAAGRARTRATRAVIASHLHGICADIPALRRLLPGAGIVEDASQALGSQLDGHLAGTLGDVAVLSLGPGKQIDAGEGGVLLSADLLLHQRAMAAACHPVRQLVSGVTSPWPGALSMRPHPMTAILALHQLASWSPASAQVTHAKTLQLLAASPEARPLGDPARHTSALAYVPVLAAATSAPPTGVRWAPSGAQVLPSLAAPDNEQASSLLRRLRLATTA